MTFRAHAIHDLKTLYDITVWQHNKVGQAKTNIKKFFWEKEHSFNKS